jgi:hypothetical protein
MELKRLFEKIYFECNVKPIFDRILRETENKIDVNNLPIYSIEINAEENKYFTEIENSKTDNERKASIEMLRNYYRTFFKQSYENKTAVNSHSGIKVELVNIGVEHSLRQIKNCYLWPAIRFLLPIIKIAHHTTETSQHINNTNTTRGDIVHIFNCKGNYTFGSETENHILRISAVTFKKGNQNNFRHLSKLGENQNVAIARLVSIEIQ